MQVSSVAQKYALPEAERQPVNSLDKNAFLQLFIAQLKNQDPLSPQDSSAFMAQLAQFGTLEQLTNMNREIVQLRLSQEMAEASALLGKGVKILTDEGEAVEGRVEKVNLAGSEVSLLVNGKSYGLYQVAEVYPDEGGSRMTRFQLAQELVAASALLGREVTVRSGGGEITGYVDKVAFTGDAYKVYVNGTGYGLDQVAEVKSGGTNEQGSEPIITG